MEEHRIALVEPNKNTFDDKGRVKVEFLSDRALLEEIATNQRAALDQITRFIEDFSKNPMFGMLSGMIGKRK